MKEKIMKGLLSGETVETTTFNIISYFSVQETRMKH
jgi:hypothetical protein